MIKKIIFLTGLSGSGKSTTLEHIKKCDKYQTYISSITREHYEELGVTESTIDKTTIVSSQEKLMNNYLVNLNKRLEHTYSLATILNHDKSIIFVDRSYIDYLVYSYMEGMYTKEEILSKSMDFYKQYADRRDSYVYNILFLKKLNNVNTNDGFRINRSDEYIKEYARLIYDCVNQDFDYGKFNSKIINIDSLNYELEPYDLARRILKLVK